MAGAARVLPVGAQSSVTGGATPRGDVILSTRALTTIGEPLARPLAGPKEWEVRVGAGVSLDQLQRTLAAQGLYYPPIPTYAGAFVGGTVATNAAGAATFKYGTTRAWVTGLTVVLAGGDILDLRRGDIVASPEGTFEIAHPSGAVTQVPVPRYVMPDVPKLSAGYFARPDMDLVDLFIGSEGTLGVIIDAVLRVIERPRRVVALVTCATEGQALHLTALLRADARRAWRGEGPLDVAAIEYMDNRALALLEDAAFARAGVPRPPREAVQLLVQIETAEREEDALGRFRDVLESAGVSEDPIAALPGDETGAARLFDLREAVPARLNAVIGALKTADPEIQKTAGDMIVPFARLADALALYRRAFETRGLGYAIWGHVSDGNLHPNVVPTSRRDVEQAREALLEMARGVVAMGGAPLAEHGVGRSPLKQRLLRELYGDAAIDDMRAVKRALDPAWKLAAGVLFDAPPLDR